MKVKYAVHTLSATVAAALKTLHVLNILPAVALATIEFIEKFDSLFDIFNSSTVINKKSYRQAFTGAQHQLQFLQKMFDYILGLKVSKKGKDITNRVQVFKFWKLNIKSLQLLWIHMQNTLPDIKFLLTRRLNQDALENFFGKIRMLNGAAYTVTPAQFHFGFRKLFSTCYMTTETGNCAEDRDLMIMNVANYTANQNVHADVNQQDKRTSILVDDHDYRNISLSEQNAFRYVCGYLMRKCTMKHSCDICLNYAREYVDLNNNSYYCFFRAYESTENSMYGSLFMPTDDFVTYIKVLENNFFQNIETLILQKGVVANLIEIFSHVQFEHPLS